MDEQRILDEMERVLAADDPKLAARLAAFGQPGFGQVLRTRRARATMSVMVLVLIAAVAAVIYMMSSLRAGSAPNRHPGHSAMSTPRVNQPGTQPRSDQVTVSSTAQRGRSAQPTMHAKFCAATFCGPAWTPAVGRFQVQAPH